MKKTIAQQLYTHFTNVGKVLVDKLPPTDIDPLSHIDGFPKNFMFRGVTTDEVFDEINSIKPKKSTIGIPLKCIKLRFPVIA